MKLTVNDYKPNPKAVNLPLNAEIPLHRYTWKELGEVAQVLKELGNADLKIIMGNKIIGFDFEYVKEQDVKVL